MHVITTIVPLFQPGSPTAIPWLIVPISVWIAIDRVGPGRAFAHIGKEILKLISPAITDSYSPPPVVFPCFLAWEHAATYHRSPSVIGGASYWTESVAMRCIQFLGYLFPQATAASGHILSKGLGNDIFQISAIAQTQPNDATICFPGWPLCYQIPKSSTAKLVYPSHGVHCNSKPSNLLRQNGPNALMTYKQMLPFETYRRPTFEY